uniref:Uncharacterized protein n=1 Tax=Panagrellus redivivus TaxID=6233 RepID=A0A7E4UTW1_PANRE
MSRTRKSKVGFVRKALEQEAAASVEEPELVATAVIAEPVNAADHQLTSSPSAETNVESEPTGSSQQSVPPPATATSITSVEEEPVIGYSFRG